MKRRILDLSYKHKLAHIGSNLTTADVLATIDTPARVILSAGHAGLAYYCWLESLEVANAEELLLKHGAQPHLGFAVPCSAGSLGQGLTVAVGYGLAEPFRQTHCIISDGECAEGCVWESLAFLRRRHMENLKVHVNVNGYSALSAIDTDELAARLEAFLPWINIHRTDGQQYSFLRGLNAHYHAMTQEDYEETLR